MISPLAYIHPEARIGENVEIGPFVFIDKNVVIAITTQSCLTPIYCMAHA